MFDYKIVTEDQRLFEIIENCKETFDSWFDHHWANNVARGQMLSEDSPLPHVYYKMTKSFDEVKRLLPDEGKVECSSCECLVSEWIEIGDDNNSLRICKECSIDLQETLYEWLNR